LFFLREAFGELLIKNERILEKSSAKTLIIVALAEAPAPVFF